MSAQKLSPEREVYSPGLDAKELAVTGIRCFLVCLAAKSVPTSSKATTTDDDDRRDSHDSRQKVIPWMYQRLP